MLTFYIDDQSAWVMHGIWVGDDITESIPKPRFNEQSGDGIDGTYRYFLDTYDDITQSFTCYFSVSIGMSWKAKLRHIKAWLLSFNDNKEHQLQFADDFEWYKRISKIELGNSEYIGSHVGKFTLEITCEPYDYMVEGQYEHEINEVTYNSWWMCKPIYVLRGEANTKQWFEINGYRETMTFNRKCIAYFDVDKGLAYDENGSLLNSQNHQLNKYVLNSGLNTIKTSEDADLKVIPNWRCV
jgi:phage-related protein